jgi:hypothetical protein
LHARTKRDGHGCVGKVTTRDHYRRVGTGEGYVWVVVTARDLSRRGVTTGFCGSGSAERGGHGLVGQVTSRDQRSRVGGAWGYLLTVFPRPDWRRWAVTTDFCGFWGVKRGGHGAVGQVTSRDQRREVALDGADV